MGRADLLRREPYRVLFPLGVLLSWAGVGHWLLYSLGLMASYRPIFHAMAQVQGFLMCMGLGFLFTMIPRRTATAPPASWQLGIAIAAPVGTTVFAWYERWIAAQVCWLVLAAMMLSFLLPRLLGRKPKRRPPNGFVWIPAGLMMGVAGSLMTGLFGYGGSDYLWAHDVGRGLLLQGMFTCFVIGVGGLALPLITRGAPPPDAGFTWHDHLARAAHAVGAILVAASFWVGHEYSLQLGYLLRGSVVLVFMLFSVELWRAPLPEGWNRMLIWASAWLLPLGFLLAAAFPAQHKAGLHVVFLGGFALLALTVSTHVTLAHTGRGDLAFGRTWQIALMAGLVGLAIVPRGLMEFDPVRYGLWLGGAAVLFLLGTTVWLLFLVPKMQVEPNGVRGERGAER